MTSGAGFVQGLQKFRHMCIMNEPRALPNRGCKSIEIPPRHELLRHGPSRELAVAIG